AEHYTLIKTKWIVQERSIDFPWISFLPEMQETAEQYRWMDFNTMIGDCNISWVEKFYANALGTQRMTTPLQCVGGPSVTRRT
ncbi:hypothetical protein A2U01_0074536, partial [Trifolium medium]|nr:hypothetical protein [Trifolium medium]